MTTPLHVTETEQNVENEILAFIYREASVI